MSRRKFIVQAAALLGAAAAGPLRAQEAWPARSIRLVVSYAPGGTADIVSRLAAAKASLALGQPIVVENRPGGSGSLGIDVVLKSPPDGYTFVCIADSGAFLPVVRPELKWDANRDLVPVSMLVTQPIVIAVHPSLEIDTFQDLIALARRTELQYAVSVVGSTHHLAAVLLAQRAGIKWQVIPYKGGGQAINDLVAGRVKVGVLGSGPVLPQVKAGRLKLLAVTTAQRSVSLPDVPTVAESGYPGYEVPQWFGVFALAGTPAPIVARMQRELAGAIKQADVVKALRDLALDPVGSSSADLGSMVQKGAGMWRSAAKQLML